MTTEPDGPTNATRPDGTRYYRGGCVRGMPMVGACRRDCLHRATVLEYRDSRHVWEEARENGENMQLEDDDYRAKYPPPTFKQWLLGIAGLRKEPQ